MSEPMPVNSLLDLPDEPLQCLAFGHGWDAATPTGRKVEAYGRPDEVEIRLVCSCGRTRRDLRSPQLEVLDHRGYGGGYRLVRGAGVTRSEAIAEWYRRIRSREQVAEGRKNARAAALVKARQAKAAKRAAALEAEAAGVFVASSGTPLGSGGNIVAEHFGADPAQEEDPHRVTHPVE